MNNVSFTAGAKLVYSPNLPSSENLCCETTKQTKYEMSGKSYCKQDNFSISQITAQLHSHNGDATKW